MRRTTVTTERSTHAMTPAVVVMTATIAPPADAPALARVDPALRLADYCEALRFYLALPTTHVDRIVFIENTNSDLTKLREIVEEGGHGKRVMLETFAGNGHPPAYGKGYGEFKLLDHGLAVAAEAGLIGEEDRLWKVTGRLRVTNMVRMLETAPRTYEVYADFRRLPMPWVELRLFSCTLRAYDALLRGRYREMRDDRVGSAEVYLFDYLLPLREGHRIEPRFRRQPHFAGRGGRLNNDLGTGKDRLKHRARQLSRTLTPWIWM